MIGVYRRGVRTGEQRGHADHLPQHVGLERHDIAAVAHLIEQLIDRHKVVFEQLFGQSAEVVLEHIRRSVQELDHQQRRTVV